MQEYHVKRSIFNTHHSDEIIAEVLRLGNLSTSCCKFGFLIQQTVQPYLIPLQVSNKHHHQSLKGGADA